VTHRVNAAVDAMQSPTLHTAIDCLSRKPELQQLPPRNDSMLTRSELGYEPLIWPAGIKFAPNMGVNLIRVGHSANGGAKTRADTHTGVT
jgi:hypothetical protein